MANTIRIKRKIGSAQSAPGGTNNAGEIAFWKAGPGATDKLAFYFNDGTQWVSVVDQVAQQALPTAGAGTAGRVPTADASGGISWVKPAGVSVVGVTAGADQGSIEATFNNDAITVTSGEVLIYTYKGSAYIYSGGTGAPVTGATSANFTVLGAAVNVDTQHVDLGTTAADIGAAWTALGTKPVTVGAVMTLATFKGDSYALVSEGAPGTAASWQKLSSASSVPVSGTGTAGRYPSADAAGVVTWNALPYATAAEVKTGTEAAKILSPKNLMDNVKVTSAGASDAGHMIKLNAAGKIDPTMLDAGGLKYGGNIDVTAAYSAPTPAPVNGNFYTVAATGAVDGSWNTHMSSPPPSVTAGDLAFYSGGTFYLVESAIDASALVHKAGSNAIAADMNMIWTAPAAAGTVIINGADNTKSTIANVTLDLSVVDGGTYT